MAFVLTVLLLFLVMTCIQSNPTKHKYAGYKLLRMQTSSPHHVRLLRQIETRSKRQAEVWQESRDPRSERAGSLDMLVSPDLLHDVRYLCEVFDIPYEEILPDVMEAIQREHVQLDNHGQPFRTDKYHTYQEITDWILQLNERCPQLVSTFHLATSWQGRPVQAVKLSVHNTVENSKPVIWMDAGIHADEWIGPATLLYFIDKFCNEYGVNTDWTSLLNHFDLYFVPLINVDGYVYTWDHDRLWRKTRSVHDDNSSCVGVDMNRNWDIMWTARNERDSDPCSRMYAGPRPFSEPELQGLLGSLQQLRGRLVAYLAYHSYSQLWMLPYGFSPTQHPADYANMLNVSQQVVDAIESVHGTRYYYGTVAELVGRTTGASIDYVKELLRVPYTFGVELRDRGTYGMLLPSNEIVPNAEESLAGLVALANWISRQDS